MNKPLNWLKKALVLLLCAGMLLPTGCTWIEGLSASSTPSTAVSSAASSLASTSSPAATRAVTNTPAHTTAAGQAETAAETDQPTNTPIPEQRTILIWVPPQFDSSINDDAAKIFSELFNEFTEENPNTKISIRVKNVTGDSSAVNSLSAAVNAAPEIVPSLVIMSRNDLVTSVQKGLIYPISTGLFTEATSWFPYARQSSVVNNLIYGIPIAGDPLVLVYRPARTGAEVNSWDEILSRGLPIAFNPSSSEDLFSTFIYLTQGGKITNDVGQPWLDQAALLQALQLFLAGGQRGAFPPSLAQGSDANQNWQMFLDGSIHLIVTKLASYRHNQREGIEAIPLPLPTETSAYPLVNTWNVVLTNSNPEHQNLAVKLAEKFANPTFNDKWTEAAGYLPVRTSDLSTWEKDPFYDQMMNINNHAELIPVTQILSKIVPVINYAVSSVIRTSETPEDAAVAAIEALE